MPQEPIKLGKAKRLPSGKVRWAKMFNGKAWKSSAYESDSRRNRQAAWQEFKSWRDQQQPPTREKEKDEITEIAESTVNTIRDFSRLIGDNSTSAEYAKFADQIQNQNLNANQLEVITEFLSQNPTQLGFMKGTVNQSKKNKPVDSEVTAKVVAAKFVKLYEQRARIKDVSVGRFGIVRIACDNFLNWFGAETSVETIDEQTVSGLHSHFITRIEQGENQNTIATYWDAIKTFLEHSAEQNPELRRPDNLRSKLYSIPHLEGTPNPFTVPELDLLLSNCTETTELYLLLMLNCGMYQGDIADLKPSEVDWDAGRIIRNRSKKTNNKKKSGKKKDNRVNWILWDRTFELLKELGHREGLVVRNTKGESVVTKAIINGKETKTDNVYSAYCRVITKLKNRKQLDKKWNKSLLQLRKTGANIIEQSEEYAEFYELFLDHSSVAKRNYLLGGRVIPKFDATIKWYGKRIGQKTSKR